MQSHCVLSERIYDDDESSRGAGGLPLREVEAKHLACNPNPERRLCRDREPHEQAMVRFVKFLLAIVDVRVGMTFDWSPTASMLSHRISRPRHQSLSVKRQGTFLLRNVLRIFVLY
jgi:hypothetical protein